MLGAGDSGVLPLPNTGAAEGAAAAGHEVAINSDDMNALLQAAFLPPPTSPQEDGEGGPEAVKARAAAAAEAAAVAAGVSTARPVSHSVVSNASAIDRPRNRTSSDEQRPLWRSVLVSIEKATVLMAKQPAEVSALQSLLAQVCHEMIPKLHSLGAVGVLCQQRLAALMNEVGLAPGAPQPTSGQAVIQAATNALAALKRYATSSMLAPTVSPRSGPKLNFGADAGSDSEGLFGQLKLGAATDDDGNLQEGDGEGGDEGAPKLHACKNCQRAKTGCTDQRPCARCLRLGVPCDGDMRAVKRACAACKRSKVKCDLDDRHPNPCSRCTRLGSECTPHVPNKKKRTGGENGADGDDVLDTFNFGQGLMPVGGHGTSSQGGTSPEDSSPMFQPVSIHSSEMPQVLPMTEAMLPPPTAWPAACMPCSSAAAAVGVGIAPARPSGSSVRSGDGSQMHGIRSSAGSCCSMLDDGLVTDALSEMNVLPGADALRSSGVLGSGMLGSGVLGSGMLGSGVLGSGSVPMVGGAGLSGGFSAGFSAGLSGGFSGGLPMPGLAPMPHPGAINNLNSPSSLFVGGMSTGLFPSLPVMSASALGSGLSSGGLGGSGNLGTPAPLTGLSPANSGRDAAVSSHSIVSPEDAPLHVASCRSTGSNSSRLSEGKLGLADEQLVEQLLGSAELASPPSGGIQQRHGSIGSSCSGGVGSERLSSEAGHASSRRAAMAGVGHPTGAPLLPLAALLSREGWTTVATEGNVTVSLRQEDHLWLVSTDVHASPATVAAGLRQLIRTWGVHDSLVRSVTVLSEGGGVPPFVSDCACCFEQLFQVTTSPSPPVPPLDLVLRSVWSIHKGQHTCAIRPAAEDGTATAGAVRAEMSADMWVLTNPIEPGSAVMHLAVLLPPSVSAAMRADGANGALAARRMVAWTRRLQEAAVMLRR